MLRSLSVLASILWVLGCNGKAQQPAEITPLPEVTPSLPSTYDEPHPAPAPSPSSTAALIYAMDWSEITIFANFAKTVLDGSGHFITSRNACGKEVGGALELDTWNKLAKIVNKLTTAAPRTEPYCIDRLTTTRLDGTVEVAFSPGKRLLYDARNWQICSQIEDSNLSNELLDLIDHVITSADKEECPNGWGSG